MDRRPQSGGRLMFPCGTATLSGRLRPEVERPSRPGAVSGNRGRRVGDGRPPKPSALPEGPARRGLAHDGKTLVLISIPA